VRNNIFITTGGVPVVLNDGGGTDLLFQGNDYWSSGAAFQIQWAGTTYASVDDWRANTGQETLNGGAVGFQFDPRLKNPGMGHSIWNPDRLAGLSAYQLRGTSPLRHSGLDLSQFGVAWDPYGFAADVFVETYFNATPTDYYGDPLPATGSGLFSIGADQLT
jgi:hypothetical protein